MSSMDTVSNYHVDQLPICHPWTPKPITPSLLITHMSDTISNYMLTNDLYVIHGHHKQLHHVDQ